MRKKGNGPRPKLKKVLALLLAFTMIFALNGVPSAGGTVFAAELTDIPDMTNTNSVEKTEPTDELEDEKEDDRVVVSDSGDAAENADTDSEAGAVDNSQIPEDESDVSEALEDTPETITITEEVNVAPMTFGASPAGNVASVGGTEYGSLEAAVQALGENGTLTLLQNISNTESDSAIKINLPAGAVLDGGNYTLEGNIAVYVNAGGGTIQNVKFKNIHNSDSKLSAVYASGLKGSLKITGCEFDTCDWDAIQTTPVAEAVVDIQNNTFKNTGDQGINTRRYVHVESAPSVDFTITVTNNKFYDGSKLSETALEVYYPTDVNKVKLSGNYMDEPVSSCIIMNRYASSNRKPELVLPFADENLTGSVMPEASITQSTYNYYYYLTLQDAVDAASGSKTITLLSDVSKNVTIAEGKSITLIPGNYGCGTITNKGTLTVSSSTSSDATGEIINQGTLELKCNAAAAYDVTNTGKLNITGGEVYDLNKITGSGTVEITGGTFTTKPSDTMIPDGYIANALTDGTGYYKVAKMTPDQAVESGMVASNSSSGGTYYRSISASVNANDMSTYLQKDVEETIVGTRGATRYYGSIYANGHKLTGSLDITSEYTGSYQKYYCLRADKGGTIELTSAKFNGDLRAYDGTVILDYAGAPSLTVGTYDSKAELTVKDAKIEELVNVAASGTLNIEGGSYNRLQTNIYYKKGGTEPVYTSNLKVTGGTFASDQVTVKYTNHTLLDGTSEETVPLSNYVPEGYTVTENSDGTYTVVRLTEENASVSISDGSTVKYYASLEEALAKVEEGNTMTLLRDVNVTLNDTGSDADKADKSLWCEKDNVIFDLNGKTLTTTSNKGGSYNVLNILGTGWTLRDGNIKAIRAEGTDDSYAMAAECENGTILIENVSFTGGIALYDTITATLKGSNVISATNYYCVYAEGGAAAVIEDGTYISNGKSPVLYAAEASKITVIGGGHTGTLFGGEGSIEVSGGYFDQEVPEAYIAMDMESVRGTYVDNNRIYSYTIMEESKAEEIKATVIIQTGETELNEKSISSDQAREVGTSVKGDEAGMTANVSSVQNKLSRDSKMAENAKKKLIDENIIAENNANQASILTVIVPHLDVAVIELKTEYVEPKKTIAELDINLPYDIKATTEDELNKEGGKTVMLKENAGKITSLREPMTISFKVPQAGIDAVRDKNPNAVFYIVHPHGGNVYYYDADIADIAEDNEYYEVSFVNKIGFSTFTLTYSDSKPKDQIASALAPGSGGSHSGNNSHSGKSSHHSDDLSSVQAQIVASAQTGDSTNIWIPVLLLVLAMAGIGGAVYTSFKKKKASSR